MKNLMIVLAMFVTTAINAQNTSKEKPANYKIAEELLTTMNMSKAVNDGINEMVDMQAKSNPMLASKKDAFKTFAMKYMSWDALKEDYTNIYATEFTEGELKDMIAFYKTPTGQKVGMKQGVIVMKSAQMGQERMQSHMDELQKIMME